jgi:tetratricopeptide (TPR) repeat protein
VATRFLAMMSTVALLTGCAQDPHQLAQRAAARGDDFARRGQAKAALLEYRNAVRAWPTWGAAHEKLGDTLADLGRRVEAYRAYAASSRIVGAEELPYTEDGLRAVVSRTPGLVAARIALADLLLSQEAVVEAEEHLLAATAAQPGHELANRALAAIYLARGERATAEHHLRIAAAHQPQRYRSQLALADYLMEEAQYPEARQVLEQARDVPRFSAAATVRIAAIDYEEGAIETAHRSLAILLQLEPTAEAWTLKGQWLFREDNLTEALAAAQAALALNWQLAAAQNLASAIRREQLWPR